MIENTIVFSRSVSRSSGEGVLRENLNVSVKNERTTAACTNQRITKCYIIVNYDFRNHSEGSAARISSLEVPAGYRGRAGPRSRRCVPERMLTSFYRKSKNTIRGIPPPPPSVTGIAVVTRTKFRSVVVVSVLLVRKDR